MENVVSKFQYIEILDGSINMNFSTAKNGLDFNMNTENGLNNLKSIENWFNLEKVGYLKQTHSDNIILYDGSLHHGDAIITDKPNVAVGVFTADCVPILIYSKKNKVVAAVHSGWQGTLSQIVLKTVKKIINEYKVQLADIKVYIGPHNRSCCYDFGKDTVKKFYEVDIYKNKDIYENGKLNIKKCIVNQLLSLGLSESNIKDTNVCTFCGKEYEMFSYRKNKENSGRMFSFIFNRE
jgi:YfiH family protein